MAETYDLAVRGGLIYDGSGNEPFRGDVAVRDGLIVAVGDAPGRAREEIDAAGQVVTPGFIDVHTHYDGQAIWSERLNPSSGHGVTTVLMGNCGVGFAPCRPADHELLVKVMEGVEDIPEVVMTAGLDWSWETFPEFLDAAGGRPHDIDFAVYLPHSPLRVYAMGERGANREPATAEDMAVMRGLVREAMQAGAVGVATSSVWVHKTADGHMIPSYHAAYSELEEIAAGMADAGGGLLQVVIEVEQGWREALTPLVDIGRRTGAGLTFTLHLGHEAEASRKTWEVVHGVLREGEASGVNITGQLFPRPTGLVVGLQVSAHPFCLCPSYLAIKDLPLAERVARMRSPELRARLLEEAPTPGYPLAQMARNFEWMFPMKASPDYEPPLSESVASLARAHGVSAKEHAYDMLLEDDGKALLWVALANFPSGSLDQWDEMLHDQAVIVALGDGGAHYGMVCDSGYPTFLLSYWARDRHGRRLEFAKAVEMLTAKPARAVGLLDRGRLAPGYKADMNLIDLAGLCLHKPEVVSDLPGGARRLDQRASGYLATIVSGEVIQRNGEPTKARPGRLVRGAQPAPAAQPH